MTEIDTSSSQPLPAHVCPLCNGPNACAPAACGSFDVSCWCTKTPIPRETLSRIPAERSGKACICASCATLTLKTDCNPS